MMFGSGRLMKNGPIRCAAQQDAWAAPPMPQERILSMAVAEDDKPLLRLEQRRYFPNNFRKE
jgi:hypothetical protein